MATQGVDGQQVALSIRARYGHGIGENWSEQVQLPLRAIREIPGGRIWYAPLVDALPKLAEIYRLRKPEPVAASDDFRQLGWASDKIARLGQLLQTEFILVEGSTSTSRDDWRFIISPKVLQFSECKTAAAYFDLRVKKADESQRQADKFWGAKDDLLGGRRRTGLTRPPGFLQNPVVQLVAALLVTVASAGIAFWLGWT